MAAPGNARLSLLGGQVLLAALLLAACGDSAREERVRLEVVEVLDGHLLKVRWRGTGGNALVWEPSGLDTLVLQGIYAGPHAEDPWKPRRIAFLRRLLRQRTVYAYPLVRVEPRLSRRGFFVPTEVLLADGTNVNLLLIRKGLSPFYAKHTLVFPLRRVAANHRAYALAERAARAAKAGIWGQPAAAALYGGLAARWERQRALRRLDPVYAAGLVFWYGLLAGILFVFGRGVRAAALALYGFALLALLLAAPFFLTSHPALAIFLLGPVGLYYGLIGYPLAILRRTGSLQDLSALLRNRRVMRRVAVWLCVVLSGTVAMTALFRVATAAGRSASLPELAYRCLSALLHLDYARPANGEAEEPILLLGRLFTTLFTLLFLGSAVERHASNDREARKLPVGLVSFLLAATTVVLFFANLYFVAAYESEQIEPMSCRQAFWLSAATFFTVDYAGFVPATSWHRVLVCLEASIGILFTSVLAAYVMATHPRPVPASPPARPAGP